MPDTDALWADFAQPDRHRRGLHRLAARPADERLLHGRAGAGAGRPSGDLPLDQRHGRDLPAASERPELGGVQTPIAGLPTNRFLHVPTEPDDLVAKHEMQRELGRRTGTCFQRCVGLDAIGACHSVTFDIDAEHGTDYHQRFLAFLKRAQTANIVIGGAMTDPKGDRSQAAAPAVRPRPVPARRQARRGRHLRFPAPRCTRPARSTRTG